MQFEYIINISSMSNSLKDSKHQYQRNTSPKIVPKILHKRSESVSKQNHSQGGSQRHIDKFYSGKLPTIETKEVIRIQ